VCHSASGEWRREIRGYGGLPGKREREGKRGGRCFKNGRRGWNTSAAGLFLDASKTPSSPPRAALLRNYVGELLWRRRNGHRG